MPSFRASPLLRSHLFFEDDMTFHSPPRVRFAASVEFQQFHKEMLKFMTAQNKINTCFADPELYYITSAHLNIEFCQFMQNHATMIRSIPVIYKATLCTLDHMKDMFIKNSEYMSDKLTKSILSDIKTTQDLLQ